MSKQRATAGGLLRICLEFNRLRKQNKPLVLASVFTTEGSSYQKAGAQMLITSEGTYFGMLSGGCLEGDLLLRVQDVFNTSNASIVDYDMRDEDDLIMGLGSGCLGLVRICLQKLTPENTYQPFSSIAHAHLACESSDVQITVESQLDHIPIGSSLITGLGANSYCSVREDLAGDWEKKRVKQGLNYLNLTEGSIVTAKFSVPHRLKLLICGGGLDALSLVTIASMLGWHTTLVSHQSLTQLEQRFPMVDTIIHSAANKLDQNINDHKYDAAMVMSHHLISDTHAMKTLIPLPIRYIGLLGPPLRRAQIFKKLDLNNSISTQHVYAPAGLSVGALGAEQIAISITAEILAVINNKMGYSMDSRHQDNSMKSCA